MTTALYILADVLLILAVYLLGVRVGRRAEQATAAKRDADGMVEALDEFGPVRASLDGMDLDEWDVDRPRYHRSPRRRGGDL